MIAEIEDYLDHFNNTTGPELAQINNLWSKLSTFQTEYEIVKNRTSSVQDRYKKVSHSIDQIVFQLKCYQNSTCNVATTTTPLPPAPGDFNNCFQKTYN